MKNFKDVQVTVEVKANTKKENSMNKEKVLKMLTENGAKVEIKDSVVFINGINLDELRGQILNQGTINYPNRYRRWVMAQMFKALNHRKGYQGYLDDHAYDYVLKTTEDELKILAKMQKENPEEFKVRCTFFNPLVVFHIASDVAKEIYKELKKTCRHETYYGTEVCVYKAVRKGKNVTYNFRTVDEYTIHSDLAKCLEDLEGYAFDYTFYNSKNYKNIYQAFKAFYNATIKLPDKTKKPVAWVEAYKASGAYYTLENMIYNHGCILEMDGNYNSKKNLEKAREKYCGNKAYFGNDAHDMGYGGYRFLGLLKEVIEKNNFDFYREMDKKYNGYRW